MHKEKKVVPPAKLDDKISNGAPIEGAVIIEDIDYELEESMVTFAMIHVLKSQKHYRQALAVLKMLESKDMDADRISKERSEIQALLSEVTTS